MEGVTDAAFRFITAKYGQPDVIFTEFASVDGICSDAGFNKIKIDLQYDKIERPIVAQLFGSDPKLFKIAAEKIEKLGFDGVDINMGCPDKSVVKMGAGSALILNPDKARGIIKATKEGLKNIPISVKTRIGFEKDTSEQWIPILLDCGISALTIHARTKQEMWRVPNHFEVYKKIQKYFIGYDTVLIGNGDIDSYHKAREISRKYRLDGAMIGRASSGNPWVFSSRARKENLNIGAILNVMIEHAGTFDKYFENDKNFVLMNKHFASYLKGNADTKDLKISLMKAKSAEEAIELMEQFKKRVLIF
ncbi:MAG: tRNA-dihydrouridine synthase [Patescibacteria group bacterium]